MRTGEIAERIGGTVARTGEIAERISGTAVRTDEIAGKIGGIVMRIDGAAVKIATMHVTATGMPRDITDATIAVMVRDGLAEAIASTAARTTATIADATTAPPA